MIKTEQKHGRTWYVALCLKNEPRSHSLLGTLIENETYLTRKFPLQGVHRVIIAGPMIVNGIARADCVKTIPQDMAKDCLQYVEVPDVKS